MLQEKKEDSIGDNLCFQCDSYGPIKYQEYQADTNFGICAKCVFQNSEQNLTQRQSPIQVETTSTKLKALYAQKERLYAEKRRLYEQREKILASKNSSPLIRLLSNNVNKETQQKQKKEEPRLQNRPNLEGVAFLNHLKSQGLKDEAINILCTQEINSLTDLRQCTQQALVAIGLKLGQVIKLKKL